MLTNIPSLLSFQLLKVLIETEAAYAIIATEGKERHTNILPKKGSVQ